MGRGIWCRTWWMYLLLLCSSLDSAGQSLEGRLAFHTGFSARVEAGPSLLDLSRLNAALLNKQFEPLTDELFALGFGVHRYQGRWVYGGSLYNYLVSRSAINNQIAITGYHYTTLRTGLLLSPPGSSWKVFPTLGLGGGLLHFQAKPASEPLPVSYWTGGPLAEATFNVVHLTPLRAEQGYYLELGFTGGYLRSFENAWIIRRFSADEAGLPVSPQGLFFRFTLGMGKWQVLP